MNSFKRRTYNCTGCPNKRCFMSFEFEFKRNVAVKRLHLCSFESLFIRLSSMADNLLRWLVSYFWEITFGELWSGKNGIVHNLFHFSIYVTMLTVASVCTVSCTNINVLNFSNSFLFYFLFKIVKGDVGGKENRTSFNIGH